MTQKTIPSTELKQHLGEYLGKVVHGGQTFLIEKHGKAVAALVPIETIVLKNQSSPKTPWALELEKLAEDIFESNKNKNLGPSDAVQLVNDARDEEDRRLL